MTEPGPRRVYVVEHADGTTCAAVEEALDQLVSTRDPGRAATWAGLLDSPTNNTTFRCSGGPHRVVEYAPKPEEPR